MTRVRGAVERRWLVGNEVNEQRGGADSDAGVLDFIGHHEVQSIRVPDAVGLLPPREGKVTSERPPPPQERGMSSWRKRGEGIL